MIIVSIKYVSCIFFITWYFWCEWQMLQLLIVIALSGRKRRFYNIITFIRQEDNLVILLYPWNFCDYRARNYSIIVLHFIMWYHSAVNLKCKQSISMRTNSIIYGNKTCMIFAWWIQVLHRLNFCQGRDAIIWLHYHATSFAGFSWEVNVEMLSAQCF